MGSPDGLGVGEGGVIQDNSWVLGLRLRWGELQGESRLGDTEAALLPTGSGYPWGTPALGRPLVLEGTPMLWEG